MNSSVFTSLVSFIFQLMDENGNGYLNVREMVCAIGITCAGPPEERLRTLFKLHMPPLLTEIDLPLQKEDETFEAAEATEFFQNLDYGEKKRKKNFF